MTDDVRRAWANLSRVAEPPCGSLVALVEEVGPEAAADMVRRQEFADGFEAVADGTVGRAQEDRDRRH